MTREAAWKVIAAYYRGMPIAPDTLIAAMHKIDYRRKPRVRLHPLPAIERAKANMVLLFNIGKYIGAAQARRELQGNCDETNLSLQR